MISRLGCLLLLVPILELVVLVQLGREIGFWPTLGLLLGAGALGVALTRREGLRVFVAVQSELARGRVPARELLEGAAVLVGGLLLITPGLVTDLAGFAILLPPTRRILAGWAQRRIERAILRGTLRVTTWGAGPTGGTTGGPAGGPAGAEGSDPEAERRRRSAEGRTGEIIQE